MAKVYKAPLGFEVPEIHPTSDWQQQEARYVESLATEARRHSANNGLVGEVVRFHVVDGYAQYMVWSTKPLELIHLELGDCWKIPEAHARGLNLTDIRNMVERDKAWAKLMAEKAASPITAA